MSLEKIEPSLAIAASNKEKIYWVNVPAVPKKLGN
jgi:hypothetical protein